MGCPLWGLTESDMTEATQQQQQNFKTLPLFITLIQIIYQSIHNRAMLDSIQYILKFIIYIYLFSSTQLLLEQIIHTFQDYFRRRRWHPTPVLLPGKSHGRRSLVGCSPWDREELDTTERLHFHALEKEMATHSSVLTWRIPGTGEPGGLPFLGSHRVGHD